MKNQNENRFLSKQIVQLDFMEFDNYLSGIP